jgi:hypothetical protein
MRVSDDMGVWSAARGDARGGDSAPVRRRGLRRLVVAAAFLSALGVATVVWYSGWGVHGCNDLGGDPLCGARMDRDFSVYLVGLASLACGVVLAIVIVVWRPRALPPNTDAKRDTRRRQGVA